MNYIQQLKNKLGDFWWYSIMIFLACRSGDVIQAFIGLWLVPKYVGQQELGAVLPLQQLCGLFAVPLAALATVFAKYVNTYATRGEYGKVKSFILDVLRASIAVFVICIIAAYFILPHFYLRLNVASGLLTVLILASGFIGNISQLFTNALQGLKKFNTITVINLIGAPIRLVTLLVAMPFRALSGYILGQTTPPASSALVAAFTLRKEFKSIPVDTSWRKDLPEIVRYFLPILIFMGISMALTTINATIYRQRLPKIESSAYYILTRFSEIASYLSLSMTVILFPLAAEAHEKGKENTKPLKQTIYGTMAGTFCLALLFAFGGNALFSSTEPWEHYLPYSHLLPISTLNAGFSAIIGTIVMYDIACKRFFTMYIHLFISVIWTIILVCFTGYGFFKGILPDEIINGISAFNLANLSKLIYIVLCVALLKLLVFTAVYYFKRKRKKV